MKAATEVNSIPAMGLFIVGGNKGEEREMNVEIDKDVRTAGGLTVLTVRWYPTERARLAAAGYYARLGLVAEHRDRGGERFRFGIVAEHPGDGGRVCSHSPS